jgi:hypothetical protein
MHWYLIVVSIKDKTVYKFDSNPMSDDAGLRTRHIKALVMFIIYNCNL